MPKAAVKKKTEETAPEGGGNNGADYDAKNIQVLGGMEAVR